MQQEDIVSFGLADSNPALEQIRERGYSNKYQNEPGKGLFEVGGVFSAESRNLVQADWLEIS